MVTITITAATPYILSNEDWRWLRDNYYEPLKVLSLNFSHVDGSLFCLSVLKYEDTDKLEVVTLFPQQNNLKYTLEGLDTVW